LKLSYYIINSITIYRLISAFALLYFIVAGDMHVFRWLLAVSFFTDAIDGFLARKLKVTSVMGSRFDSIADDVTILMAVIALIVYKREFIMDQIIVFIILLVIYIVQNALALIKYHRLTSFHTWLAKIAAIIQATFLILIFFLPQPPLLLFFMAAAFTFLDLTEEIILVLIIPEWKADVKSIWKQ
jgi:phosphatidylglycerophosphate synthase